MTEQADSKVPRIRFKGFEDGWLEDQLGEKVDFFSGLTYSPSDVQKGVGTLVLRSSNVKNGEIVDADNVYVDSKIVNSKNVEVGDIAVVVRNGSRSLIGKHAQIKNRMDHTVIGAFMTGIHSKNPAFTNALLDTPQFDKEIAKNLGATINQITTGAFRQMMFRFPRCTEQTQIGEYFQELDRLIGLHQRKHDKLVTLKQVMLQKMFPQAGATTPEIRFKGFEGDWEEKKLGELTETGFTNGVFNDPRKVGRGYRLINVKDMFSGSSIDVDNLSLVDLEENEFKNNRVRYGDIFFTRSSLVKEGIACSNVNLSAHQNITFDGHLIRMQPCKKITDSIFLSYAFKTASSRRQFILGGKTTTMTTIGQSDIAVVGVALPTKIEQTQIGTYFRTLDELISKHAIQLQKLKQIKSACLEKMFV